MIAAYHDGSGLGSLLGWLAHSVLWHLVGRLLWGLPLPAYVVLGLVAGLYVVRRRRARA